MAATGSVVAHALTVLFLVWLFTLPRTFASVDQVPRPKNDLVWLAIPGPGGGGGGGGDETKVAAPAREVGKERVTVPPAPAEPKPAEEPPAPPPPEPLTIPAKPLESSIESVPGLIAPAPSTITTQGPGTGGGSGSGTGTGAGEGRGSGLGPGFGGGTGGGAYKPGSGVSTPQLLREAKPDYTVEAMRAKMQGVVLLECVVEADGSVGECRVVKSLDTVYGLDEQALKAAAKWRFLPGRRLGEAVPVLVTIELTFTLR